MDTKALESELASLKSELKGHFEQAAEREQKYGSMGEELKSKIDKLQTQADAIDAKIADRPSLGAPVGKSAFVTAFEENEEVKKIIRDRSGKAVLHLKGDAAREFQRKTVITENVTGSIGSDTGTAVGYATTGVLPIDRTPGITMEARQTLRVRNELSARPTTAAVIDFVKVSSPMSIASPVAEGSLKPENQLNFSSASERVKTIATWVPASRQILDDLPELMGFIKQTLPYYVDLAEERQLLSGDGTGENLHGLIPQASSFSTGLLPSAAKGWTKIDVIGVAIEQVTIALELDPTFVVLNPRDWWDIRLQKDGFGRYILGDPQTIVRPSLFGLDVVPTVSIAAGTFLLGSGSPIASEIRDRMETTVEISTEHSDFFQRNLVAVRGEKRLALVVKRPASYITGTFTTSP